MKSKFVAYLATHTTSGKVYVGITTNMRKRWDRHIRQIRDGLTNSLLHKAIRKHGMEAFKVDVIASAVDWINLCALEVQLIAQYDSFNPLRGYNMTAGGEGSWGLIKSEATRSKISMGNKGKIRSPESRERYRTSKLGTKKPPFSAEHRAKLAAAMIGRQITPESIEKMKAALKAHIRSEQHKQNLREAHIGMTHSAETRAKISFASRRKRKPHSAEARANMSAAAKARWAPRSLPLS